MTRSMASMEVPDLNHYLMGLAWVILADFIIVSATSESNDSISFWLGCPVKARILYNWFNVELPGKNGFPFNTSAKIHPMLQMSAD